MRASVKHSGFMRVYWTLGSVPELGSLPKLERSHVWRSCYRKAFRHWQTWLALALFGICGVGGGAVAELVFNDSDWIFFICVAVGSYIGACIFGQIAIRMAIPHIRLELSHRDPNDDYA